MTRLIPLKLYILDFMKLFLILGNQLFNTKYLNNYKDHIFFMAEDMIYVHMKNIIN